MIFKSYQTDSNITFSLNKTYLKNLRSKMLPKTKTGLFASAIKKVHELSMVKKFLIFKNTCLYRCCSLLMEFGQYLRTTSKS